MLEPMTGGNRALWLLPSLAYGAMGRARRQWYSRRPDARRRLGCPVISVGNLTVGGSGKTPLVAHLARLLIGLGERPAILSRGYGRRDLADGVVVVSDGDRICADLDRAGDEPLMLARAVPGCAVLVSPDRYLAGRLAERAFRRSVHLLDDGFQHLALARDVDLLIAAPGDLAGEWMLPLGRLREPAGAARQADALIMTDMGEDETGAAEARFGLTRVFRMTRTLEAPRWLGDSDPAPAPGAGLRVLAVTGVARPERFVHQLREAGWAVADELHFGDHERYTRRHVDRIARAARDCRADLVLTTEKDRVRLLPFRPIPARLASVPLTVTVDPAAAFRDWLAVRLRAARENSAIDERAAS
jgi:tetraacyldisaccharide 4'-kinase